MVLQDFGHTSTSSDGFDDNPYPSDSDTYSSSSSSTRRFDPSMLPQPIPILGPLIGFPQRLIHYRTEQAIKFADKQIGRVVTQEEGQALASHLYKMEQTNSYFTALGVGLGAWRCYSTAAVNRYPMFLPKPEKINPNKFLIIRGPLAQYSRHVWRATLYIFVAGQFGNLCGRIVSQPVAVRGFANDPRMTKFTEDVRKAVAIATKKAQEVAKDRRSRHGRRQQTPNGEQPGQSESSQAEPSRYKIPIRGSAPAPSQDDMSPTADNDSWSSASDVASSFSSEATLDSPAKPEPYQRPQTASPWGREASSPENDDASPTGGLFQDEVQNQSKPSESSWERLRRGGGPPAGQRPPPPPQRSEPQRREPRVKSNSSDSFPYVEEGQERDSAQARAQHEFDARLQREREGQDFNEEKRW